MCGSLQCGIFMSIPQPPPDSHDFLTNSPHRRLSPVRHSQFPQNMLHMFFNGFVTDAERRRDLLVRQAVGKLYKDVHLPVALMQYRKWDGGFGSVAVSYRSTSLILTPASRPLSNHGNGFHQPLQRIGLQTNPHRADAIPRA